jgi:hypothetical protein
LRRCGFLGEGDGHRVFAGLNLERLPQKFKLTAGHRLNDGIAGPLCRNWLALELEQVVDCYRNRFHCRAIIQNGRCPGERKPPA